MEHICIPNETPPASPGICAHCQLLGLTCQLHLFKNEFVTYLRPENCPAECHLHLSSMDWTLSKATCQKWHNLNHMWTASPCAMACFVLFFCDMVTSPQAMIFYFFSKCYPGVFSFTPEMIGSVNHVSCVWHVPLSCLPVNETYQINSLRPLSQFSLKFTFTPSLQTL